MRVFVGIGEGAGNCVMALPLIDSLHAEGHEVFLNIRPTPESILFQIADLIAEGRAPWLHLGKTSDEPYDAASLTFWWLSRGGPLPKARDLYVGNPPSDEPEILSNLAAAPFLKNPTKRAVLHFPKVERSAVPCIAIHPGCKDDPEWKRRKVYPRWAEVTHRLKDRGAVVTILGLPADDAYCGEPQIDARGLIPSLSELARRLPRFDCLVSGDSGLHHMAVALGVPTVAIFGESSVGKATHPDALDPPTILRFHDDPTVVARMATLDDDIRQAVHGPKGPPLADDGHEPDPVT